MDGSLLFDPQYLPIILATLIGFSVLAAALLVPVWRFLDREEKVAEKWTPDQIAEHIEKVRAEQAEKEAQDPSDEAFSDIGSEAPEDDPSAAPERTS
jgi:hypothetical protein